MHFFLDFEVRAYAGEEWFSVGIVFLTELVRSVVLVFLGAETVRVMGLVSHFNTI